MTNCENLLEEQVLDLADKIIPFCNRNIKFHETAHFATNCGDVEDNSRTI